ncbi:biosynthetic-type acetolactate synthase large subunit [Alloscardovia macacae]|uniref:Acetolactate synthase n=1 Tax=Alloscardovia macacae TaxID=1160091 RepID=A0A261F777_9BIFI|nr:biosynthetic-type acetolactate synthase large subunit [Alloscardovia macacae]OZG54982.1 acetolactate synthase [Alloscardovia macacae]
MALPTPLQAFSAVSKPNAASVGISAQSPQTAATPAPSAATAPAAALTGEKMTGAQALVRSLEDLGVTDVFGIPGGAILPVYHALNEETKFRFILTRHEQAAGHAAEGYALATGKPGVAIVTSGPGATNTITSIMNAQMDSVPLVVITGQVGAHQIGTDAFQETDTVGITYPIAKHSYLVTDAQDIPRVLTEAYHIAGTGRPGPVVIDLTRSAQTGEMFYSWPQRMILPGYSPTTHAHGKVLSQAARLIQQSFRPVLYVGGGAMRSGASEQVQRLVDATNMPVVTTLNARGIIPDSDTHNLGMIGMHGSIAGTGAVQNSDLLIALGARFSDRVTGKLSEFAPRARVIHIDIDPAEIGKNREPDVPIVGDIATVLDELVPEIQALQSEEGSVDLTNWWALLDDLRANYPSDYTRAEDEPTDGSLSPQWVVKELSRQADPRTIWVAGVGQHQMWASQLVDFERPRTWLSSAGAGTMGFGLPAALGARVASERAYVEASEAAEVNSSASASDTSTSVSAATSAPSASEATDPAPVWLIDGDGSFQMTSQELATIFHENTPVKIAILNNSVYGMVRQWQTLFFDQHYSATMLHDGDEHAGNASATPGEGFFDVPDFVKLAEAYGCVGLRATTQEEAEAAIEQANAIDDRTVLIDFRVWKDAMVWPMVPAGNSNDNVLFRLGEQPLKNVAMQREAAAAQNARAQAEAEEAAQNARAERSNL